MHRTRRPCRRLSRSLTRQPCRRPMRTLWRAPDDLATALTAYRHVIRAHRRMGKLAPRLFDSVVVEHERRFNEEQRQRMAEWIPAIAKAYGTDPEPYEPDPPPPPSPSVKRALLKHLAAWEFWMSTASTAMDRYQERRPHDLMSFGRMARLLEIAMDLGQLACGIDRENPNPQPLNHDQARADLKRGYGHLLDQNESQPPEASPVDHEASPLNGAYQPASIIQLCPAEPVPASTPPAATAPPGLPLPPPSALSGFKPRRDVYAAIAKSHRNAAKRS